MALQRMLGPTLLLVAAFWANAAPAAPACDPRTVSMYYAAEKSAWDSENFARLNTLNLEEAKYADTCGHAGPGLLRPQYLERAATQYRQVGVVELGKHHYAVAKKHLERSNAIFHELQATGTAPRPDYVAAQIQANNESLARIPKNAK